MLDKLARLGMRAVRGARQAGGAITATPVAEVMSGVSRYAPRNMSRLPYYGAGGIFAGEIVADTGMPAGIRDALVPGAGMADFAESELEMMLAQHEGLRKRQELEAAVVKNAAALAAVHPQLYTEVMAGRRLPRGARVFGGAPRTDLLQELALNMAQGNAPAAAGGSDLNFLMR